MQDVRLVAGVNGHVAQCPLAQAECPTCGEFHTLRSVVARLEKSLQHLADKVCRYSAPLILTNLLNPH